MTRKITRTGRKKPGAGKVVTGLVFGSITGNTVGLLFAPASEEETIRKIKGEVRDIQKKAKKTVGDFAEIARDPARDDIGDVYEAEENE